MRVLALDTTTRAGSVALVDDDRVRRRARRRCVAPARRAAAGGDHRRCSRAHGLPLADVDLFAVASGPGSFTGLRIGIATIQGLAFVARRPHRCGIRRSRRSRSRQPRLAPRRRWSARGWTRTGGDVFTALYRVASAPPFTPSRLVEIEGPAVGTSGGDARRAGTARDRRSRRCADRRRRCTARRRPDRDAVARHPRCCRSAARRRDRRHGGRRAPRGAHTIAAAGCSRCTCGGPTPRSRASERTLRPCVRESMTLSNRAAHRRRRIDDVLAHRGGVVHQPVDARDVPRRAGEPGVSFLLSRARREPARRSGSARSGGCSTSCTSTIWRCCRNTGARASRSALLHVRAARRAPARAPAGDARSAAIERAARRLYERFGFTVAGVRRGYYTQPVEDALVLWRESNLGDRPDR